MEGASDFGNACQMDDLFKKTPYPSLSDVLGSGTACNISNDIISQLKIVLNDLKSFKIGAENNNSKMQHIMELASTSEFVSYKLLMYRFWMDERPPFLSYKKNRYFEFDPGLNAIEKEQVMKNMKKKNMCFF